MLQFHQRLKPFRAISFDLDDTLYDNRPVMKRAEQHLVNYLQENWPATKAMGVTEWRSLRDDLAKQDQVLAGNMTALRLATLKTGLQKCGLSSNDAQAAANDSMDAFLAARNDVQVPQETHQLLSKLKERWPLVALSNGNVDIQRIGLGDYFERSWQPSHTESEHVRGKPYPDMFQAAYRHLNLQHPNELLHIGDHPEYDVAGALRFGAQPIWFGGNGDVPPVWLPAATVRSIDALETLLTRG